MARDYAPSDIFDLVEQLPIGALLRVGDRVFPNNKFKELTGFCPEGLTTMENCLQQLFPGRWEEMLHLYETDRHAGFRQSRIVSIRQQDGNVCWVEWMGVRYQEEEILFFQDVTHLWKSRIELTDRTRQLERQLFERTENLEKTVNMLLLQHHQVQKNQETNHLLAQVLEVNQQLLELLHHRLSAETPEFSLLLEKSTASLRQLRHCCLGQEQENIHQHLKQMEELLWQTKRRQKQLQGPDDREN